MSLAAVDGLIAREEALIAALDAGDAGQVGQAALDMRDALMTVAATGGWHGTAEVRERVLHALRLAEAAGGRVNYLADANRRRLDRLTSLAGQPRAETYGRSGRYR